MFAPSSTESIRSGPFDFRAPAECGKASPENTAVRSTCPPQESTACVLIPARNEAATIGQVVRGCRRAGFSVTVIDDASSDSTAQLARQAGAEVVALPGPHHGKTA